MINIKETFAKFEDEEFLKFDHIIHVRNQRSDLHAFLLLDELLPSRRDIIAAAEHDKIYLDADPEDLAEVATEDDIIELIRCGVMYDNETSSLTMYA